MDNIYLFYFIFSTDNKYITSFIDTATKYIFVVPALNQDTKIK